MAEAASQLRTESPGPTPTDGASDLALWNGLPPARQLCWLRLRGCGDLSSPAKPSPPVHRPTHWRLTVGEVESVVQAAPEDKKRTPVRDTEWSPMSPR